MDLLTPLPAPYPPGHCVDLPDTGLCKESISRWYYNPFSEHCARFTYGGCYGNKNNFEEEQQCLESCRGISSEQGRGGWMMGRGKPYLEHSALSKAWTGHTISSECPQST